jgi:hypothetical protein
VKAQLTNFYSPPIKLLESFVLSTDSRSDARRGKVFFVTKATQPLPQQRNIHWAPISFSLQWEVLKSVLV